MYWQTLIFFALTYITLTLSLNISVGYGRLLCLCQATFYGVGAYSVALLPMMVPSHSPGLMYVLGVFVGIGTSALLGGLLSLLGDHLKDDYFLMSTFAFSEIAQEYLANSNWSGGNIGLRLTPMNMGGVEYAFIISAGVLALVAFWVCGRIERSHFGLALITFSVDESLSTVLGNSSRSLRFQCMAVSAALAAFAGCIAAPQLGYIHPTFFGIDESVLIFTMLTLGGLGSRYGAILGAFVLAVMPSILTFFPIATRLDAPIRQIIYGLLLIVLMRLRPAGLIPHR